MQSENETAHFFWHGPELSIYEWACISSFVRADFSVRVWSYLPIRMPEGALAGDASGILPQSELSRYTQGGKPKNIAAFTDFFRYALLQNHPGWWFDTDVICLRRQQEFQYFSQPIVAGFESPGVINGAVLKFNDLRWAIELGARAVVVAQRTNNDFKWGAVGPALVTEVVDEAALQQAVLQPHVFYPVHWKAADLVLDPARRDEASSLCARAHAYHLWNEVIRRCAIPKNILPPQGSFLHDVFVAAAPEIASLPALPADTLYALVERARPVADPGFVHHVRRLAPSLSEAVRKRLGSN